ncbi:PKD domain-containing protein [bacterium]|nr:PKD domain-containing protein [bacterium]
MTVADESGNSTTVGPREINALPDLTADFTTAETGPLTVQFDATAQGGDGTYTFTWDLGDGSPTQNGQTLTYTYAAPADYSVTLTVTDGAGSSVVVGPRIVTIVDVTPTPIPVDEIPVRPNRDALDALRSTLRPAVDNAGSRLDVFAIVGDNMAIAPEFLDPFDTTDPSTFTLDGSTSDLQAVIDLYNADTASSTSSFIRSGVAAESGLLAIDLLSPSSGFAECPQNTSRLVCEITVTGASVVLVNIGQTDAQVGTDPTNFTDQMRNIVEAALNAGAIPVLSTIYPQPGNPDLNARILALNEADRACRHRAECAHIQSMATVQRTARFRRRW